jgi:hypothetical protein
MRRPVTRREVAAWRSGTAACAPRLWPAVLSMLFLLGAASPCAVRAAEPEIRIGLPAHLTGVISYRGVSRIPVKTVFMTGVRGGHLSLVKALVPHWVPPP